MTTTRMGNTITVLNRLQAEGAIGRYAIAGAVAAFRHVAATVTDDLDLLVSLGDATTSGLVLLDPIYRRLKALGYSQFDREGLVIEGWPVQFLPVASALDEEALEQAEEVEIPTSEPGRSVLTRAIRAEHIVAKALGVGRAKDLIRVHQFIEERAVDLSVLKAVIDRHGLNEAWRLFCMRSNLTDPLSPTQQ
jgi:hypothetical protein